MSVGVGDAAPDFTLPGTGGADVLARPTTAASRSCSSSTRATTRRCAPSSSTATTTTLDEFERARRPGARPSAAQDVDSHERFAGKHGGSSFPLLADTDKAVAGHVRHARPARLPAAQRVRRSTRDGVVRYAHRAIAGLTFRSTDELVRAVEAAATA